MYYKIFIAIEKHFIKLELDMPSFNYATGISQRNKFWFYFIYIPLGLFLNKNNNFEAITNFGDEVNIKVFNYSLNLRIWI